MIALIAATAGLILSFSVLPLAVGTLIALGLVWLIRNR